MSSPITLTGRLAKDPELRFAATGNAVASFTVVTSGRKFDKDTNKWVDIDVTYWNVSAFKQMAENVVESMRKGDRIIVTGKMKSRKYEDKEGNNRTVWEVAADHVGVDLFQVSATVNRVDRGMPQPPADNGAQPDPWSTPFVPDDTGEIPF